MSVTISCGICGESFRVADSLIGQTVQCSGCQTPIDVRANSPADAIPVGHGPGRPASPAADSPRRRKKKKKKKARPPVRTQSVPAPGVLEEEFSQRSISRQHRRRTEHGAAAGRRAALMTGLLGGLTVLVAGIYLLSTDVDPPAADRQLSDADPASTAKTADSVLPDANEFLVDSLPWQTVQSPDGVLSWQMPGEPTPQTLVSQQNASTSSGVLQSYTQTTDELAVGGCLVQYWVVGDPSTPVRDSVRRRQERTTVDRLMETYRASGQHTVRPLTMSGQDAVRLTVPDNDDGVEICVLPVGNYVYTFQFSPAEADSRVSAFEVKHHFFSSVQIDQERLRELSRRMTWQAQTDRTGIQYQLPGPVQDLPTGTGLIKRAQIGSRGACRVEFVQLTDELHGVSDKQWQTVRQQELAAKPGVQVTELQFQGRPALSVSHDAVQGYEERMFLYDGYVCHFQFDPNPVEDLVLIERMRSHFFTSVRVPDSPPSGSDETVSP